MKKKWNLNIQRSITYLEDLSCVWLKEYHHCAIILRTTSMLDKSVIGI
ncbi:hypothetical protein CORMATOL_02976 [Corynebacterium matruchotii ATCC 33806]|uniref:Uncharacterized protein n=1 Tax=Corynebacterium matruchotii ATCC 33806 TaxID=566549 RepID=C0E7I7_9CORY|nr:hypothetical protein CORMATOL_02976 [Corynebacterium matruchotii ATCC 33806]